MTPQEKFIKFLKDNDVEDVFIKKTFEDFLEHADAYRYIDEAFIWGKDYNFWDKINSRWRELLKEDK